MKPGLYELSSKDYSEVCVTAPKAPSLEEWGRGVCASDFRSDRGGTANFSSVEQQ